MKGRIYTREDIVKKLDVEIQEQIDKCGEGSFWVKVYRDRKNHVLAQYDAGEKVVAEYEEYVENGVTYATYYFSDGTIKKVQYQY